MVEEETLKEEVTKLLVASYDFTLEEAEERIEESMASNPGMWNENAEPNDLAKYIASDDDDV